MRATLFLFGTSWTLSASWWAFFVAMALATGGALASDPRFAGVDWADARNRLRAYVWKRVDKTLEVDDIVQSAILKALEPGARVWDRAKQSIFLYVGSYANSVMWGQLIAAHRRRCGSGLTPAVLATLRADGADPHETLTTPSGTLYYWTSDLTLAQPEYAEYWVPSIDPPDTTKYTPNQSLAPASVGRLELSFTASFIGDYAPVGACVGVTEMATFSEAGMTCYAPGGTVQSDPFAAAVQCADGAALVLFDNNGSVTGSDTSGPPSWNPQSPTGSPLVTATPAPSANPTATWEVDEYLTEDGVTVYAFVCRPYPETKASYPLQVYNHGGFGGINGALGPAGNDTTTDELGLCLNAANNGWIGAAPSYRGEGVHVKNAQGNNAFPPITSPAQGQFEFCLGEVTDSIALVNHFLSLWSVIYHGRVPELVPQIIRNEVLMWGWSHGGCVTQRAVQQGGPVNAAATFSAMADDPAYYNWCVLENPVYTAQGKSVRCDSTKWPEMHGPDGSTPLVLPNAYNWRSSVWFESVDVGYGSLAPRRYANEGSSTGPVGLKAHPNVPVLMLQGGQDQWIPTDMACNLAANLGSSCSTWYYGKTPWVPGGSLDPNQALETHCANLPWQLLVADAGVAAVENWTANSNLVWLDDDDHTNDPNRHTRGILNDVESWHNFRAFVHQLGWGVEVATTTFVPQDAPVPQVLVP